MDLLDTIKQQGSLDAMQLVRLFSNVADNGHVLIVKSDGPRDTKSFTAIISFPDDPTQAIRHDGDNLLQCVFACVEQYNP